MPLWNVLYLNCVHGQGNLDSPNGRFELSNHGRVVRLYVSQKSGWKDVFYKDPERLRIADFIKLNRRHFVLKSLNVQAVLRMEICRSFPDFILSVVKPIKLKFSVKSFVYS
jgi:hypothetical protein